MLDNYLFGFTEGVLTFLSPCILPMIPIYFFYLAGVSADTAGTSLIRRNRLILNSIGFVLGFTLVFVALGATATSLGTFLKSHPDLLKRVSGAVMILLGLNFAGVIKLKFLDFEKRIDYKFKDLKFYTSILFGMVFAFAWTPCASRFLGAALADAATSSTVFQGMMKLFVYSLGLGVPFILTAILFDQVKNMLKQIQKYSRIINVISGIVLIAAGILFILETFNIYLL
ncbi:MAG: cytochrome c biogenesis CcdA family protein [Clostridia bacterium]|nr:cytochrome c biogenesis CcdA family protein [Clostridia bacterium]